MDIKELELLFFIPKELELELKLNEKELELEFNWKKKNWPQPWEGDSPNPPHPQIANHIRFKILLIFRGNKAPNKFIFTIVSPFLRQLQLTNLAVPF